MTSGPGRRPPEETAPEVRPPGQGAPEEDPPEETADDLYEHAPCGHLSTTLDGRITRVNATLLAWLGHPRERLVGRMRFADLLTAGGRLYHETHFAPLLRMRGEVAGIALELRTADGGRLPVLVASALRRGPSGEPLRIRTAVFAADDRRAYEKELLRARREAERARGEAERQREAAERDRSRVQRALATLQASLLPPSLPEVPGLEAASHYHTASPDDLGGDFYDLFPVAADRWCFFLGDVCGKGPEAAALTSLARYTLHTACLLDPDPVRALHTLNAALLDQYTDGDPRFCTVTVDTLTRAGPAFEAVLAGGGHPPALRLGADGTAAYLPTPGGVLVGVLPEPEFASTTAALGPGDTLLLYTDGLTEARTRPSGRRFGDDALEAFAARLAPSAPARLVTAAARLLDDFGPGLDDDTALLALGVPVRPDR